MIFHKYQQKKTVKCQFYDDGCQTYLIFQPLYNLLEITGINDTAYVTSWVSICLPTENIKPPAITHYSCTENNVF